MSGARLVAALLGAAVLGGCGQATRGPAASYTATPSVVARVDRTHALVRFAFSDTEVATGVEVVEGSPSRVRIRLRRPPRQPGDGTAAGLDGLASRCGIVEVPPSVELLERHRAIGLGLADDCHDPLPPTTIR